MKVIIKDDFFDIFPNAKIGVLICQNINNKNNDKKFYENLIAKGQTNAKQYVKEEIFTDNEVIKYWRSAYQKFKTKKGARSSIESLLKRVKNANPINSINPLVDIYNYISMTYGIPCGSEDIDKIEGDLLLAKAVGNEEFMPLGAEGNEPPHPEELIYKDELGAVCRCLNWREAKRTMISNETTNAVICLEIIDDTYLDTLNAAMKELEQLVAKHLGGTVKLAILNKSNNTIAM